MPRQPLLLMALCLLPALCLKGQVNTNVTKYQTIYVSQKVDSMPQYKGGEEEFFRTVEENFRVNNQISRDCGSNICTLIVDFVVSEKGETADFKFGGSGIVSVEEEMKRVLSGLPNWKPAICKNEPCPCRVYIPFRFVIENQQFSLVTTGNEMLVGHKTDNKILKWVIVLGCLAGFYLLWMK